MQLIAQPVSGPPAAPPRGGLLAAAQPGASGVPWEDGLIAWPDTLGGWRIAQMCTDLVDEHGIDDDPALPTAARPFLIQTKVTDRRRTIEEMSERARRRLDAVTGKAIAHELWTGAATQLDPYDLPGPQTYANPTAGDQSVNPYLRAAEDVFSTALPAMRALGEVEARVADLVAGGPIYLHVPLALVVELAPSLVQRGELWQTPTGGIVVPDRGYPGTGPTGTARVIYGTGAVQVWTGPISVLDDPAQVVSTRDNTVQVWAERPALTLFDPQTLVACPVET